MKWYQRICPHWFGWSYIPSQRRRWCRVCGLQQRLVPVSGVVEVDTSKVGEQRVEYPTKWISPGWAHHADLSPRSLRCEGKWVEADEWTVGSVYDDLP